MAERKHSGGQPVGTYRLSDTENVGTQILASDLPSGSLLNPRPVLRVEQSLALDPIRDGLLADSLDARDFANSLGESALAVATNFNGLEQGSDVSGKVSFLHGREAYTRILVDVNKEDCFTGHKESCRVIQMNPVRAKKQLVTPKKPSKKAATGIGPDGMTLAQRLHRLMAERGIGQTELARMCSEYYAAFVPSVEEKFKQQHIFNVLQGQNTAEVLPIIAAVLDVSPLWLQLGIGKQEGLPG